MVTESEKREERENRAAERRRFDALSQEERRKELNAKGLRHLSAAPSPIEPVTGSGMRQRPHVPPAPAADWDVWAHMLKASLWQAIALSLDSEPSDGLETRSGFGSSFDRERAALMFPDGFVKRLKVAQGNLSTQGPLRLLSPHQDSPHDPAAIVSLPEFAGWAESLGWTLPERFPREVAAALGATPSRGESTADRCARLLRWFREEEAKQIRGALARVAARDGRARQTVSADIAKARKAASPDPIAALVRSVRK